MKPRQRRRPNSAYKIRTRDRSQNGMELYRRERMAIARYSHRSERKRKGLRRTNAKIADRKERHVREERPWSYRGREVEKRSDFYLTGRQSGEPYSSENGSKASERPRRGSSGGAANQNEYPKKGGWKQSLIEIPPPRAEQFPWRQKLDKQYDFKMGRGATGDERADGLWINSYWGERERPRLGNHRPNKTQRLSITS